ncbi:MAG: glycosyltransferase [Alphaproteobacteria bacterium]|nr:glycosyltransferase [Alphaproteobacteria bacterium]
MNPLPPLPFSLPFCLLQIIPSLDAGGAERACLDIAGAVRSMGGRAIVASAGGRLAAELAELGGELVYLPAASKNPLVMLYNVFRLACLIRSRKVDLMHVRSRAPAWSAWGAACMTGTPFVTTFHGLYSAGNAFKRFYNGAMLSGARVIAGSHFMAGHIRTTYHTPPEHIAVIPRGIDVASFDPGVVSPWSIEALRQQWQVPDGAEIVLLPARLTRWKGQLMFIEALAKLNRPDVTGVLCGDAQGRDDYVREIREAARKWGVSAQLRIPGHVADMPAAYGAARIAVSASLDAEAFGRVPVEALTMGCSIIAADHGGASETLRPEGGGSEFGALFPPGDVDALVSALSRALKEPRGGGPQRAAAGRAHVLTHYSTAAMCARTLALYGEVLSGK